MKGVKKMDQYEFEKCMENTDTYGNNTNFSDVILSSMTTKGLLGKWCEKFYAEIRFALFKYYMKENNIDAGDKDIISKIFKGTQEKIQMITPVLEDLVAVGMKGLDGIFYAVYGVNSDELYALEKFNALADTVDQWDTSVMWDGCKADERLLSCIS